jgi:DnaJ-class molecular chaperone
MIATIPQEDRCEACFGLGRITQMKSPRLGHPIDTSPPPACRACNGNGEKPKTESPGATC